MPTINADGFLFTFPDSWRATKYDDWAFYRNHFIKMNDGIKAVDLAVFDGQYTLWLIEVKDFRNHERQYTTPLHEEVWKKVYDTLAGLFVAKCTAVDDEHNFAKAVASARKIRVVLHMELPSPSSRLHTSSLILADYSQQLRRKIKAIDPHPLVCNKTDIPPSLQWSVSEA